MDGSFGFPGEILRRHPARYTGSDIFVFAFEPDTHLRTAIALSGSEGLPALPTSSNQSAG